MKNKPIVLASDHGGFELKQHVKAHLIERGIRVEDAGTNSEASVDYPVFTQRGVQLVRHYKTMGIFVCGSGIGIGIAANRFKGIRAAVVHSQVYAQLARQHNDANVLCLGGRFLDPAEALRLVDIFLETPFLGAQHKTRVDMLDKLG